MTPNPEIFPAFRLVAQFTDGQRLLFDGFTEEQAQQRMEAATAQHGDITWYDARRSGPAGRSRRGRWLQHHR